MTTSDRVDIVWTEGEGGHPSSQPPLHHHGIEVQRFGSLRLLPIALAYEARLEAHEITITKVRDAATRTAANGDGGTNDVLMGDVLRRHELQVWFLAEHLIDTPAAGVSQ